MHDPYAVLGLSRSATSHQVKQAYKKLALRWHPDLLPAHERPEAEAAFKNISAAYAKISQGAGAGHSGSRYPTARYASHGGARAVPNSNTSPRTYPKWQEQSWRPHGIMSPPVNPWLKKEQRATEFSHMKRWQQGKLHQSAGETEPSK